MRAYIRVQHVDLDGSVVGTFNPLEPRFAYRINDIGDISYNLALSNPQVTRDSFAPKRTHFRLQVSSDGAFWRNIMGGFHWPVSFQNEEGTIKLQGMDWAAYLDQPVWFRAYETNAEDLIGPTLPKIKDVLNDASAWAKVWVAIARKPSQPPQEVGVIRYNATQQTIIQDLIDINANGDDGTIKINTNFIGTDWSQILSYQVMFQDDTTILDHIRSLSDMDDPLGFDFFMNWDKTLVLYNSTRSGPISSITPLYNITRKTPGLVSVEWQNNGPDATWSVILGEGSPAWWAIKTYQPSVDMYGRWLKLSRLGGNYRMPKAINSMAKGNLDRFPKKELKITVAAEDFDPVDATVLFAPLLGEAFYVDLDFPPYHRINANFWIIGQEFHTDDEGNWLCDFSLQQIYDPTGVG